MAILARTSITKQAITAFMMVCCAVLAACSGEPENSRDDGLPPTPALFEISDPGGTTRGWLFGTIHALPDGMAWRSKAVDEVTSKAETLVVEVANLNNAAELSSVFASLATKRGLPLLADRVAAQHRAKLGKLVRAADLDEAQQRRTESWAAALILARAATDANPANGVDRALLREFADRPVIELEGATAQLAIFDGLPQDAQTELLVAVINGSDAGFVDPAALREAWVTGDLATLENAAQRGMMSDPHLRQALLVQRNRNWLARIEAELQSPARPLIAVGAAHLPGPDGLIALLEARGWRVVRLP